MKAYIILVGTELLNGLTIDTNSIFIAEEFNKYGIEIIAKAIVKDDISDIKNIIEFAYNKADLIIISGGLGPTIDDITRDAISLFLNKDLIIYDEELEFMKKRFIKLNISMPKNNIRQAMLPKDSVVIKNNKGTAPAFCIDKFAVFPGVPAELKDTFRLFINKYAKENNLENKIYIKDLLVWGISESKLEEEIIDIINQYKNITIEFLAKEYGVLIRLLTLYKNKSIVDDLKNKLYNRLGYLIYGEDDERLESLLVNRLKELKLIISTAESCTGGMISSSIVDVAGSSSIFNESFITYSNDAKIKNLGVKKSTIDNFGAVSKETVVEMLKGLNADVGIAVSGIAGPGGGTKEKPVGTVVIGLKIKDAIKVEKYIFLGDRKKVRRKATLTALYNTLLELNKKE